MGRSLIRVPFRVLLISVPSYFGDLKRDPNLENYPHRKAGTVKKGQNMTPEIGAKV